MLQVPGGHSLAGIPAAGFQRGADFQPPYFPPPFPQQGMEVLSPVQVRFHHETKPLDQPGRPSTTPTAPACTACTPSLRRT